MIKQYFLLSIFILLFNISALSQVDSDSSALLKTGWYFVDSNNGIKIQLESDTLFYFIKSNPIITARNIIIQAIYLNNKGTYTLLMRFDKQGTADWLLATRKSVGQNLAFIFNGKLLCLLKVDFEIDGGMAVVTGDGLSKEKLEIIQSSIEQEKLCLKQ